MNEVILFLQELFGEINVASIIAVFVLVWLWGQFGLTGKWQLLSSFVTGLVIGITSKFFAGGLTDGNAWFMAVIYGLILGGLASGFYESIKGAVSKALINTLDDETIKLEEIKTK